MVVGYPPSLAKKGDRKDALGITAVRQRPVLVYGSNNSDKKRTMLRTMRAAATSNIEGKKRAPADPYETDKLGELANAKIFSSIQDIDDTFAVKKKRVLQSRVFLLF